MMKHPSGFDRLGVFSQTSLQSNQKPKRPKIFLLLLILFLVGGGYWVYKSGVFNLFDFSKKDYHGRIESQKMIIESSSAKGGAISQEKLEDFRADYQNRLNSHPGDSILFYYCGSLEYAIFTSRLEHSYTILSDIFLLQYIKRYKFPEALSYTAHKNALMLLRKAIALGLPTNKLRDAQYKLNFLYLFSNKLHFASRNILKNLNQFVNASSLNYSQELIHVVTTLQVPNWDVLRKYYPPILITYLKAIYYLKVKNRPFGFSLLQGLVKREVHSKEEKSLVDNALYLMGYIEGAKQGRRENQFYFYSKINIHEFTQKYDWFVDEYLFILKFLGKKKEQKEFITKLQKKK